MQQTKYLKQNRSWNLEFSSVQIKDVLLQWIFRWALFSACQLIADTIWFKSQPLWHMAMQIGKQSQCLLNCCVYCFRERAESQGLTRQCLHKKKLGHEFQRREIHQPGLGLISTRPEDFTTNTSVWPTPWPARPLPSSNSSTGTVILFLGVLRIKLKIDLLLFLFMYQTNFHLFSAVCSRTLSTFGSRNVN